MIVSDDSALVGYGYSDFGVVVENNTLTTKATFEARVDGTVNKVLFFVRYFFQKFIAFFHIYVARRACAHPTAVVIQVNVVVLGQLQNGLILEITLNGFGRNARVFKQKCYSSHFLQGESPCAGRKDRFRPVKQGRAAKVSFQYPDIAARNMMGIKAASSDKATDLL